jgi:transposase-like protein
MNCPKCKSKEKCKSGLKNGKQRYLCKKCGCNYTRGYGRGYHPKMKEKAIAYYLEGCGFRRIERMLGMSHNSVINWVKQAAKVVQKISKNCQNKENVDILELDELCTMLKKNETKSGYGLL